MPSAKDELYGETVLTRDKSELYRQVATQLVKEYSEEGQLDDIESTERQGDEIEFSFTDYRIRTFSVPQTDGIRKHALASGANSEDIKGVLRELGEEVESHIEMLNG